MIVYILMVWKREREKKKEKEWKGNSYILHYTSIQWRLVSYGTNEHKAIVGLWSALHAVKKFSHDVHWWYPLQIQPSASHLPYNFMGFSLFFFYFSTQLFDWYLWFLNIQAWILKSWNMYLCFEDKSSKQTIDLYCLKDKSSKKTIDHFQLPKLLFPININVTSSDSFQKQRYFSLKISSWRWKSDLIFCSYY